MSGSFGDDLEKLDRLIDDRNRLYKRLVDKGTLPLEDAAAKSGELKQLRDRYAWLAEHAWWIKAVYAEIAPLLKLHHHNIEAARLAGHPAVVALFASVPGLRIKEIAVLSARHAINKTKEVPHDGQAD